MYRTDLFPLLEKENLTDNVNLSQPPNLDSKYTIYQVFNLHESLDNILLSKTETENIFLPARKKCHLSYYKNKLSQSIDNLSLGTNIKQNP